MAIQSQGMGILREGVIRMQISDNQQSVHAHPAVSVIVPVYNAGDHIYKCLDTLVNQTLKEIEIICVLDCPTDGTDKVVEEYARQDDRIVIVRNEHNLHVSSSRNEGLKVARGEYIGFSDHDDFRELDMYEKLYEKAHLEDADIVVSNVKVICEGRKVEYCRYDDSTKNGIVDSIIMPMNNRMNPNPLSRSVWHCVYKRAFLEKGKLFFESRKDYLEEDALFNLKAWLNAGKVGYCQDMLYCWDKHIESESNRLYPHEEVVRRQLNSLAYISDLLRTHRCLESHKAAVYLAISDSINRYLKQYESLSGEYRKRLVNLIQVVNFPLFGHYDLKLFSRKRLKLFFFVLKLKQKRYGRKA